MENFKSFITEAKEEKYRILVISAETAPGKKPLHRTARRFVEESKKTGNDIYVVRVEGAFITYDNGYKIFNANDEDGFEINIYQTSENEPYNAINLWNKILDKGTDKGLLPCGLGSRDTLRLEAGLCLYGQDLNEELNPFESRLKWTIDLNKENFVGKKSLLSNQNNINKIRVAFQSVNEGIPRHNHSITCENKTIGLVTSGSYSPLLSKGIGMGYIDYNYKDISKLTFVNRGVEKEISLIKLPFYDTSLYGHNRIK